MAGCHCRTDSRPSCSTTASVVPGISPSPTTASSTSSCGSPNPKGLVALRDTGGDGRADEVEVFGDYDDTGDYGTAMRIHDGYIYFSTAGEVYRQKITPGRLVPDGPGRDSF